MDEEPTKIEKIAKRAANGTLDTPVWVEEYNKDGIVIFSDDIFGKVKLIVNEKTSIDAQMIAIDGIIAFSAYFAGGIGGILPYVPYVKKDK